MATGAWTKTVYVGLISALGLFVPVVQGEVRGLWAISDASKSSCGHKGTVFTMR